MVSFWRNFGLAAICIFVGLLCAELIARTGLLPTPAQITSKDAYLTYLGKEQNSLRALLVRQSRCMPSDYSGHMFQHPFLGYVPRPDMSDYPCGPGFADYMCVTKKPMPINELGLYGPSFPKKKGEGVVRIGVSGGSVANLFVQTSGDRLKERLSNLPRFAGKKIEIINLAIPGYKQPQQFVLTAYLLSLGYQFDAIIDISGFNEIYLSSHYNVEAHISYVFPFYLHWYASEPGETAESIKSKAQTAVETAQSKLTAAIWLAPRKLIANSILVRWIAFLYVEQSDQRLQDAIRSSLRAKKGKGSKVHQYLYAAYMNNRCTSPSCVKESEALWEKSIAMSCQLLHDNGIKYFIFLQPNHYVVASEKLSPNDRKNQAAKQMGWTKEMTSAWSKMSQFLTSFNRSGCTGAELKWDSIFTDSTKDYLVDAGTHLTARGYNIVADTIAGVINKSW
ncbi:MAG: hypothetical protein AB1814_03160 [Thermodesulfobacteriota bacterium]